MYRGYIREKMADRLHELLRSEIKPHLNLLDATAADKSGESLLSVAAGFRGVVDSLELLDPRSQVVRLTVSFCYAHHGADVDKLEKISSGLPCPSFL